MRLLTKLLTSGDKGGSLLSPIRPFFTFRRRLFQHRPFLRVARLCLLCSLLSLTAACQRFSSPEWPLWLASPWGATPTPAPAPITTHLAVATWSSSDPVNEYFRARLLAYQQMEPATAVELQLLPNYTTRLKTLLESEEPLDVVRINAFALPDLVARKMLLPLPAQLVARTSLSPLLRTMTEVDSKTYCLPHEINTLALFYNRDLFAAAQLAYPTAEWNWETLRTTAEQLTDAEAGHYGLALPADFSRWLPFLYGAGGAVVDSSALTMTINSPAALTALHYYTNLVLDGMAASPATVGSRWSGEALAQGRAAMVIEGNWLIPYLQAEAPTVAYGVAPLPSGPVGKATIAFVNCYALAAKSANVAAAADLLEFLANADSQQAWLPLTAALPTVPELQAAWSTAYPTQLPLLDGLSTAYPWRFDSPLQPVIDEMNEGIQQIYGGFVLAEGVLAAAETTGNERLKP